MARFGGLARIGVGLVCSVLLALAAPSSEAFAAAWSRGVEINLPANAGSDPHVNLGFTMSCASAGNCTAVGEYTDSSSHVEGLLLTETSGVWATGVEATLPVTPTVD